MSINLAALADDNLLETAFAWLCQQRKDWAVHADVWDLRARWPRLGVLSRVTLPTGDEVDVWSARDALVLKVLALVVLSSRQACRGPKDG